MENTAARFCTSRPGWTKKGVQRDAPSNASMAYLQGPDLREYPFFLIFNP